jgi:predicted membrane protein
LLIAAGALLFLDNLGILPIGHFRAYWPVFIVIWGASMLRRGNEHVVWALAIMAFGVLLILGDLHIIHVTAAVIWPVLLIAFGIRMLMRPPRFHDWRERHRLREQAWRNQPGERSSESRVNEATVFGSMNRRVETQQFEGGKIDAVFGSVELDLSGAAISSADGKAEIEMSAVFGGIEVTVPRTWKVVLKSTAVFGGCDDRTVPPRVEAGIDPPTLIITGDAVFGGITIRN